MAPWKTFLATSLVVAAVSAPGNAETVIANRATSAATARAEAGAAAEASGGTANLVVEADRRFSPANCDHALPHCATLAIADALWAMGHCDEARAVVMSAVPQVGPRRILTGC